MTVLELDRLSIAFSRHGRWIGAVRDLSLTIAPGEAYGLVGESGSGKSTAAMAALAYLPRNGRISAGRILLEGRDMAALTAAELRALRGHRIAAVYQNPGAALNPVLTVGRQLAEVYEAHGGLDRRAATDAAGRALARVRIPNPARTLRRYPHEISGGMQQRVVIAMALAGDPALLVLDEPTTALDTTVQAEVLRLFSELRRELRAAVLFISHNLAVVREVTDRVGVLYAGELVEEGRSAEVFARPRHPYTRALVGCLPRFGADKRTTRLVAIPGTAPDLDARPPGCPFQPRCPVAQEPCATEHPALVPDSTGRPARCPYTDLASVVRPSEPGPVAAPSAEPLLVATAIRRSFGSAEILRGVDLDVRRGETVGLVGESGSGKSTLAKVVAGLIRPGAGSVTLDGDRLAGLARQRPDAARRAVQMVFQSPDTTLNPRHGIGFILRRSLARLGGVRGKAAAERAAGLLAAVRMSPSAASASPRQLSGGQRQRIAIARAFAGEPRMVILDEPTSALDVSVQAAVLDLLIELQYQRGTAYLLISHDLAVVRYLADRIAVLHRGELVEVGPADRVLAEPAHPYTRALMASMPDAEARGAPPEWEPLPDWREVAPGHSVRCWSEPEAPSSLAA